MTSGSPTLAQEALDPMARMLAADGYELSVVSPTESQLELWVTATQSACAECLIPRELFSTMAQQVLTDRGIHADVVVRYPDD